MLQQIYPMAEARLHYLYGSGNAILGYNHAKSEKTVKKRRSTHLLLKVVGRLDFRFRSVAMLNGKNIQFISIIKNLYKFNSQTLYSIKVPLI